MEENKLYSGGQKQHIKELKLERTQKIKEIKETDDTIISSKDKKSLIRRIKLKFKKFLEQTNDSLYLTNIKNEIQ